MAGAGAVDDFSNGYLLIAVKPDLFMPLDKYRETLSREIARIKQTEKQQGVLEIRIPGERSARERQQNLLEGIVIDRLVYEKLLALASNA